MSHIVSFRIEGLAGRQDPFETTMDRHVNVLFGLNGCGKTSLLKILHSAMRNDGSLLVRVPFTSASVTIYSIHYEKNFTRTTTKPAGLGSPAIQEPSEIRIDESGSLRLVQAGIQKLQWKTTPADEEASKASWNHRYLPTSRLLTGGIAAMSRSLFAGGPERLMVSEEQIDAYFAESIKNLWINYTSQLLSRIGKAQENGLASILKAVLSPPVRFSRKLAIELDSHQAYESMKKFVTRQGSPRLLSQENDFKKRYEADPTLRGVVLDINKIENEIEQANSPRRQLEDLISNLFSGGKTTKFTDQSIEIKAASGVNIGLDSLSSGEKHLLMLLVDTLLAQENSMIIDEPEISMHVDWQRKLIQIMRVLNPEAQLIVATHSPEIMADIADEFIKRM
jgi:predicted ATP-dependent endonuclease of OLD family